MHYLRRSTAAALLLGSLFSSPATAMDLDSPYGVVAFVPGTLRWDAISDAGIGWARCDFSWRMVETSQDVFDWSTTDYEVAEANLRGIQIYAGLGYTPAWASNGGRSQDPPRDAADWYDYVYRCVSRYKDYVHYWELWNEPNISAFWAGTRQQYMDMILKVGADAAHAADPDCFVLAPEISECCSSSLWLQDALGQAGDKIDIIAVHRYGGGDVPSGRIWGIDNQHSYIVSLGYGNKPTWVTECGFPSDQPGVTEQIQGEYLQAMLAAMPSRPWWQNFYWYQIWEGPVSDGGLFGLLYQNETRKPAWYAYRDYIVAHPAAERVSINLSTSDINNGITRISVGDGDTVAATQASRACRRNADPADDFYMYFNVDDLFVYAGNRPALTVICDYYDGGSGALTLQYDSAAGPYTAAGSVSRAGVNTWKQARWTISDAWFANRQNDGADFRIAAPVGSTFFLDTVAVTAAPRPGPGRASRPSPVPRATGVSANTGLSWTAGTGAVSHNVFLGTTNPPAPRGNQATTVYDPGTLLPGTTYYWRVDEVSPAGTTMGFDWSFTTLPLAGPAGDPNPPDGATGVSIAANLSWTAGSGAASHDVYFGTANPPAARGNQTETTYDPAALIPGTTYYWRIDEVNAGGTRTGAVWSFTTLPLPGPAGSPSPAHQATGVSVTADLSWSAGSDTSSHDVFFGTSNPPAARGNQPATTYDPGTLMRGTTYFWRIDELNASGRTTGAPWSFRTAGSRADFNADGDVDQEDFAHLQVCLGDTALPYPPGCQDADLVIDGSVDSADFNFFQACFGGPNLPPPCP